MLRKYGARIFFQSATVQVQAWHLSVTSLYIHPTVLQAKHAVNTATVNIQAIALLAAFETAV